MHECLDVVND